MKIQILSSERCTVLYCTVDLVGREEFKTLMVVKSKDDLCGKTNRPWGEVRDLGHDIQSIGCASTGKV